MDRLDRGLNPLGFSDRTVPFDISAVGLENGTNSHFEQILERAVTSLNNANAILDRAQRYGNAMRQLRDMEQDFEDSLDRQELSYDQELISIFGYPYEGDIGPAGTYAQGYDGPDLYHFMWMDFQPFGLAEVDTRVVYTNTIYIALDSPYATNVFGPDALYTVAAGETAAVLIYERAANGLVVKPAAIAGQRRASGRIQMAYIDFLKAYGTMQDRQDWLERTAGDVEYAVRTYAISVAETNYARIMAHLDYMKLITRVGYSFKVVSLAGEAVAEVTDKAGSVLSRLLPAPNPSFGWPESGGIKYVAQFIVDGMNSESIRIPPWPPPDGLFRPDHRAV